jgi:hypothetical protein
VKGDETPENSPFLYEIVAPNFDNIASITYTVYNGKEEVASGVSKPADVFSIEERGTSITLAFTPEIEDKPYSIGRVFAIICQGGSENKIINTSFIFVSC